MLLSGWARGEQMGEEGQFYDTTVKTRQAGVPGELETSLCRVLLGVWIVPHLPKKDMST